MKIYVLQAAQQDTEEIVDYLVESSRRAAIRFTVSLKETYQYLKMFPFMGVRYPMQSLRFIPVKKYAKYLIFYRIFDETIEIVRILHISQNIESILDEAREQD